jgi:hypothetical protein
MIAATYVLPRTPAATICGFPGVAAGPARAAWGQAGVCTIPCHPAADSRLGNRPGNADNGGRLAFACLQESGFSYAASELRCGSGVNVAGLVGVTMIGP